MQADVVDVDHVRIGDDPFAVEDAADRAGDDLEVEAQADVVHVPDIHVQALAAEERVAALDLGPAGDAGPRLVAAVVFRACSSRCTP